MHFIFRGVHVIFCVPVYLQSYAQLLTLAAPQGYLQIIYFYLLL